MIHEVPALLAPLLVKRTACFSLGASHAVTIAMKQIARYDARLSYLLELSAVFWSSSSISLALAWLTAYRARQLLMGHAQEGSYLFPKIGSALDAATALLQARWSWPSLRNTVCPSIEPVAAAAPHTCGRIGASFPANATVAAAFPASTSEVLSLTLLVGSSDLDINESVEQQYWSSSSQRMSPTSVRLHPASFQSPGLRHSSLGTLCPTPQTSSHCTHSKPKSHALPTEVTR